MVNILTLPSPFQRRGFVDLAVGQVFFIAYTQPTVEKGAH